MDTGDARVTYHKLSSIADSSGAEQQPPAQNGRTLEPSRTTSNRPLPIPTILEDLHSNAQKSNSANFPLLTRYLPTNFVRVQNGYLQSSSHSPVLGNDGPPDAGCEHGCSSRLLGETDGLFKYSRLQSGLSNHRFLCSPFSIRPSDIRFTSLHWNCPIMRQACLLAVCTCVAAILCIVVGFLIAAPLSGCEDRSKWHRGAIFYEIFPASFQDTDGDGYGDLKGIIRRLDYIKSLGVTGIRLNSVFCALDYPLEYEHIIDLRNVDPHLGKLRDFRELVREAHHRGMRVVLDLNPTVTSDQHTWALHWQRGIEGYEHFYASANRSKAPPEMEDKYGPPPEEWELTQRTFGGHYVVNWSNPSVQSEYTKTLSFWIDVGVDGFHMKHLEHLHVLDKNDILDVVRQWRDELDRIRFWSTNRDRILITSLKFVENIQATFPEPSRILDLFDLVDVPLYLKSNYSEDLFNQVTAVEISPWRSSAPGVVWHLGSADSFRLASRLESKYREAALYSLLMLPESVSVFYGDELGLIDSYDVLTGIVYRGGQFTPMQWTPDNQTRGFTNATVEPWLPMLPEQRHKNVQSQSLLIQRFSDFASIRNIHNWNWNYKLPSKDAARFQLERRNSEGYKLEFCANFGHRPFLEKFSERVRDLRVRASTDHFNRNYNGTKSFIVNSGDAFVVELHV